MIYNFFEIQYTHYHYFAENQRLSHGAKYVLFFFIFSLVYFFLATILSLVIEAAVSVNSVLINILFYFMKDK